jgi:hypothetical protein
MEQIILLGIGGIILIIILLTLLKKLRNKRKKILQEIQLDIQKSGETIIISPEGATFNGADKEYGSVKCNGVIAATEKRIIFKRLMGSAIGIRLDNICKLNKDKWFHGYSRNNLMHFIIELKDENKIAFFVKDCDQWIDKIGQKLTK